MFYLGQKVICVEDRFSGGVYEWGDQLPVRGFVYTIRRICWGSNPDTHESGWTLLFFELTNLGDRLGFADWRFRAYEEEARAHATAHSAAAPTEDFVLVPAC